MLYTKEHNNSDKDRSSKKCQKGGYWNLAYHLREKLILLKRKRQN